MNTKAATKNAPDSRSTSRSQRRPPHLPQEACCTKIQKLREFLASERLQLWAASGDDDTEDLALWVACASCEKSTLLSVA